MGALNLKLLRWHVLRYLKQHPLLVTLNVLTVALGVAVYLAIQLANESASRSFAATIDVVAGKAQLQITAPAGDLPETVLPEMRKLEGLAATTPLVRGWIKLVDYPGEYLQVLGIDVFTNEPFRTFDLNDPSGGAFDVQQWLGRRDNIAIAAAFAEEHQLKIGDVLRVRVDGREQVLRIGFLLQSQAGVIDRQFAAMDVGWAQELFRRQGTLSSILLRLEEGAQRQRVEERLAAILPPGLTVAAPSQRTEQIEKMLSSFRLNLTAMSLVSLLVGMFLIYNTVAASVVRRRREIGILRSLGCSRMQVGSLFLLEALVLGAGGICLGLLAGTLLARGLVGTVTETISSLYVRVNAQEIALTPGYYFAAAGIGLVAVLGAAWWPARVASRLPPVQALFPGNETPVGRERLLAHKIFAVGALLAAALCSIVALRTGPAWLGFAAAFFVLAGSSALAPVLVQRSSGLLGRILAGSFRKRRLLEAEMAAAHLGRSLWRNSVTIAAVAAAVAMSVGLSIMVFSFRDTVTTWLNQTFAGDLFIGPAVNEAEGADAFLPLTVIEALETNSSVGEVDTYRQVELPYGDDSAVLAVVRAPEQRPFRFLSRAVPDPKREFKSKGAVLISEPFARRHGLVAGSSLELPTPQGAKRFRVAAVYQDFTRDRGVVAMHSSTFESLWQDQRVHSAAVYLKEGVSTAAFMKEVRDRFAAQDIVIYSNQQLRKRVFEIFDQTFAVTYVLRTIAVIVAITGVFLTLSTLVVERSRELGILRALGTSGGQLRRLIHWESGFVGVLSSGLGLVSGFFLALVLTWVINRAFFGWTVQLAIPWSVFVITPVFITVAALVASWWPAQRAARLNIAETVRFE